MSKEQIEELRAYFEKGPAVRRATCGWAVERLEYLEEAVEDYRQLNDRMGEILTATANALKGEPGPLSRHDWSDLASYASGLVVRVESYRARIEQLQKEILW